MGCDIAGYFIAHVQTLAIKQNKMGCNFVLLYFNAGLFYRPKILFKNFKF